MSRPRRLAQRLLVRARLSFAGSGTGDQPAGTASEEGARGHTVFARPQKQLPADGCLRQLHPILPAALIASCIVLCAAAAVAGPKRIAIIGIRQAGSFAPASVTVFVSIPPAKENRGYYVIATCTKGGGAGQSSFRELEGEQSHGPFVPVEMRLQACVYAIEAVLVDGDRKVLARSDPRTVRVLCKGCPDDDEDDEP